MNFFLKLYQSLVKKCVSSCLDSLSIFPLMNFGAIDIDLSLLMQNSAVNEDEPSSFQVIKFIDIY